MEMGGNAGPAAGTVTEAVRARAAPGIRLLILPFSVARRRSDWPMLLRL